MISYDTTCDTFSSTRDSSSCGSSLRESAAVMASAAEAASLGAVGIANFHTSHRFTRNTRNNNLRS